MNKDKLFIGIGELAKLTGERPEVLRFWEKHLPALAPDRSGGRRRYNRHQVQQWQHVAYLVRVKGQSLKGVAKELERMPKEGHPGGIEKAKTNLLELRSLLLTLKKAMAGPNP